MFTLAIPDNHGSCDCYHFDTVEDAQDALNQLYDAEEDRPSLSRRDAISQLEEQLSSHRMTLECEES
jgi:hypothetical protein